MSALSSPLETSQIFRPLCNGDWPIYRRDCIEYATFYAPGYLCIVDLAGAERFESALRSSQVELSPETGLSEQGFNCAIELCRHARRAQLSATRLWDEPFEPECLTLYLNNECNLRCVYCYADPSPRPTARLELDVIAAAAHLVAENCRRKERPFYIVFHGGGEPTLHGGRMASALTLLEKIATEHHVQPWRYVATNGVMSKEKAIWLAHHFDLIGLSCDGPTDLQNSQRPLGNGKGTGPTIERTAHILCEEGCRFHVRATITSKSLRRQAEIAAYICRQLAPEQIHFEPIYIGGRAARADKPDADLADEFVVHFLEAREIARQYGAPLSSSGSRLDEIHGLYCHVFRHVLNLVPGGVATGCFKVTDAARAAEKGVLIGAASRESGEFEIHDRRVQELRRQLGVIPRECKDCFNRYHCARECPDRCPLDTGSLQVEAGFRCQLQKALVAAMLRKTAEELWMAAMQPPDSDGEKVYGILL
ncbi:MAG: radical SAM protein [Anaerolineae bacterium]|nr:radical SAM protein [Anaerolineae bacterium]